MNLLERRRAMMSRKAAEDWTYILRADSSGKVPKARIPLQAGQTLHMEWDYQNEEGQQCVFGAMNQNVSARELKLGTYPIIQTPVWNITIFQRGMWDLVVPKDFVMYVGCWNETEYTGTVDRRLRGKYIKIRIT